MAAAALLIMADADSTQAGEVKIAVITGSRLLAKAVSRAFAPEGYQPLVFDSCRGFSRPERGEKIIVFLDLACLGADKPAELKAFLGGARAVSVIAVCDPLRTSNAEMAEILTAGADDVIPATMPPALLRAKTCAHLRRLMPALDQESARVRSRNGMVEIDRRTRTVKLLLSGKKEVEAPALTRREFDILWLLLSRQDQALARGEMLTEIWRVKAETVNAETVDRHVEALRRKLGNCGKMIRTLYGVGYVFKNEA